LVSLIFSLSSRAFSICGLTSCSDGTDKSKVKEGDDGSGQKSQPQGDEMEPTLKLDYNDDENLDIQYSPPPKKPHTTESDFEPTQILPTDWYLKRYRNLESVLGENLKMLQTIDVNCS
jgi:hypothetical protein